MANQMTVEEILSLPVSVPLVQAGRAFGLGRSAAFDLYHRGEFPVGVLRVGKRLLVPRAQILRALGIEGGPCRACLRDMYPTITRLGT